MKVVINLHGWNSSKTSMPLAPLCETLGLKYHTFDFLMHGANAQVEYDKVITFDDLLAQARNEVEAFKNDEIYLVGHSMGGAIALLLQQEFKSVTKLILVDPLYPNADPKYNGGILEVLASKKDLSLSFDKITEDFKRLYNRLNTYSSSNKKNLLSLVHEFSTETLHKKFAHLTPPTTCQWYLIMGSNDPIFSANKTISWFSAFNPATEIYKIMGAGHSPYRSSPEVFSEIMMNILKDNLKA